jgi:DNA-binding CsgD family transcriptional regulator
MARNEYWAHEEDRLVCTLDKTLAAAFEYAQSSHPNRLSQLLATISNIFDADGCVVVRTSPGRSADRLSSISQGAGEYPAERVERLLLRCAEAGKSVQLFDSGADGGPAIIANAAFGKLVIYRLKMGASFNERDAQFAGVLWRNCGRSKDVDHGNLSPRVRQVLACLLNGMSAKEIAAEMSISVHTANVHTKHVYRLFSVGSRPQLLVRCLRSPGPCTPSGTLMDDQSSGLTADDDMQFKRREIQPSNKIVPPAFPVTPINGARKHMPLRYG